MIAQDIITRIRNYLDDPSVPDDDTLLTYINDARQLIAREVECIEDTYTFPLEANKFRYELPSTVLSVRRVRRIDDDNKSVLAQKTMQRMRDFNHSNTGDPTSYWLQRTSQAQQLILYPTPSEDAPTVTVGYDIIEDMIPTMTSNTAPSGTVIPFGTDGVTFVSGDAYMIFDNDADTYIDYDTATTPQFGVVLFDFGSPVTIDRADVTAGPGHELVFWDLVSSNSISTGVDSIPGTQETTDSWATKETRTITFTPITARYFGIRMFNDSLGPIVPATQGLYELKFYNTEASTEYVAGDSAIPIRTAADLPEDGIVANGSSKFHYNGISTVPSGEFIPSDGYTLDTIEMAENTPDVSLISGSPLTLQNMEVTYTTNPQPIGLSGNIEHVFSIFPNVLAYYACSQAALSDMDDVSAGISTKLQLFDSKFELEKARLKNYIQIPNDQPTYIRDYRLGPLG